MNRAPAAADVNLCLARLWPAKQQVDAVERWRALAGGGVGVLFAALLSRLWVGGDLHQPWLVAPIGASAVLVFAVPGSPLAQPWSVIGGNTLSALVGAVCAMLIPDPAIAGAVAVALAIALMFQMRCLHPPGGAAALLCAMSAVDLKFAAFPVLFNCVLLVVAGMAYNTLTGRRYPHFVSAKPEVPKTDARFNASDLDAALAHYNQVLDVSRADLEELLHHAESTAYQRRFGDLRCGDIMSSEPCFVQFGTTLDEAWRLMRERGIKALPVTDRARHLVGIVTAADFLRHAGLDKHEGIAERLRDLVRPINSVHADRPEVVGQIMTREVRVVSVGRRASELIPLFSEGGHHHVPVISEERRLLGVVTQSDLMRALYRTNEARNDST
jgi:CBS domain-containing membrane protein